MIAQDVGFGSLVDHVMMMRVQFSEWFEMKWHHKCKCGEWISDDSLTPCLECAILDEIKNGIWRKDE